MANNSLSCKTWCITVISAILLVIADKDKPEVVWIAVVMAALFGMIDAYYLSLEVGFRKAYNDFVKKIHNSSLMSDDLYLIHPKSHSFIKCLFSASVLGVYPPMMLLLAIFYYIMKIPSG